MIKKGLHGGKFKQPVDFQKEACFMPRGSLWLFVVATKRKHDEETDYMNAADHWDDSKKRDTQHVEYDESQSK
eukprot:9508727-Karenia_brevis.AAC.1